MKPFGLRLLAIASSVIDTVDDAMESRLAAFLYAAQPHIDVVVLGAAARTAGARPMDSFRISGTAHDALRRYQSDTEHLPATTLSAGIESDDLLLADLSTLYLHLGPEIAVNHAVRGLIPMWGQGAVGLLNALKYLAEHAFSDNVIQNADVLQFARDSLNFYGSAHAADRLRERHGRFSAELKSAFPNQIAAVFATGFPFYCAAEQGAALTPMLDYLGEQYRYFASKLLGENVYARNRSVRVDVDAAQRQYGIKLDRNVFDVHEFSSAGQRPPPLPTAASLDEWRRFAAFALDTDVWPCDYCVTFQAIDLYPEQPVPKDTNETCLRCRQTPLSLRNVSGSCADIDVIVVTEDDCPRFADELKRYVIERSSSYLYDLEMKRTIADAADGPVDLFVTSTDSLLSCLEEVVNDDWVNTSLPVTALWSLTLTQHRINIGRDFALAFVEQTPLAPHLARSLGRARSTFAKRFEADDVIAAVRSGSFVWNQLLSAPELQNGVRERLARWSQGVGNS